MTREHDAIANTRGRVPFRVPLNPNQVAEICRRRNQEADARTLADWVEDGLRLAFGQSPAPKLQADIARAERERELFCMVAENAPNALAGPWRQLYEKVWDNHRYWIFPALSRWSDDAPPDVCLEPRIDKEALAEDWPRLTGAAGVSEDRVPCGEREQANCNG